jgi:hypothetical protein
MPDRFAPFVENGVLTRVAPEKVGSCIDLIRSGRVHILNIPPLTIHYQLLALMQKLGVKESPIPSLRVLKMDPTIPATTHILFARTIEGRAAATVFEKGFAAIVADGTYRSIVERHLAYYSDIDRGKIFSDLRQLGLVADAP